ncbi:hypothetical protein QBC46DRAFT_383303 [Diplogelasinospora grovesii]|uniref:Uncharacterized protein n=1 Tax=Diplogelasinospora grovesii TaxID=303347 RepID=A0AAN6N9H1_9PEZI|nr:hypothetical protein QBC46DRAFT_383303 [Diplogelasinospora grovesii]
MHMGLREENSKLKRENSALKEENLELNGENSTLKRENSELNGENGENSKLKEENSKLQVRIERLAQESWNLKQKNWEFSYDIRDKQDEVEGLKKQLRNSIALDGKHRLMDMTALEMWQENKIRDLERRIKDLELQRNLLEQGC